MMDFFRKDSYYLGAFVGIVLPMLIYGVLYLADIQFVNMFDKHMVDRPDYLFILSIIGNVIGLRYFFMNAKKDKAGAGILLLTVLIVGLYFLNFYK